MVVAPDRNDHGSEIVVTPVNWRSDGPAVHCCSLGLAYKGQLGHSVRWDVVAVLLAGWIVGLLIARATAKKGFKKLKGS